MPKNVSVSYGCRALSRSALAGVRALPAMAAFKAGKKDILIATDVAARGIDVNDVTHVINHTIPDDHDTYLHRAGRTGRAGKTGTVVTLIPKQRKRRMDELLDRAEIDASYVTAGPGDAAIRELAGN